MIHVNLILASINVEDEIFSEMIALDKGANFALIEGSSSCDDLFRRWSNRVHIAQLSHGNSDTSTRCVNKLLPAIVFFSYSMI